MLVFACILRVRDIDQMKLTMCMDTYRYIPNIPYSFSFSATVDKCILFTSVSFSVLFF